jgi:hypothetical protein
MIVYKRKMTIEDIEGLEEEEELIYYLSDETAVLVNQVKKQYIVRKKNIDSNELIKEAQLRTIDEVMEFAEG